MSDTTASLRRKIQSAGDLQSVVRTMKALASSSIGQYEKSVRALADYDQTIELGLGACFRALAAAASVAPAPAPVEAHARAIDVVVFGSDQGLVGQFNELVADVAVKTLATLHGNQRIWAVGARVQASLLDAGLPHVTLLVVPNDVRAITPLVGRILIATEPAHERDRAELHLFYNRHDVGEAYTPVHQRVLPLDEAWRQALIARPWPTKALPEVLGSVATTLRALVREYLFIALFRACAESLASENASRLAAMERADKNIDGLLVDLNSSFHRLRQSRIDEELFDVVSGYEALSEGRGHRDA